MEVDGEVVVQSLEDEMLCVRDFPFVVVSTTATSTTLATNTKAPVSDWTNCDISHSKCCGPKVVGGYVIAIEQCSPLTACKF